MNSRGGSRIARREFLSKALGHASRVLLGGAVVATFVHLQGAETPPAGTRGRLGIVRPPGSLDEQAFLGACIRCTRCADACEARCIELFGPEAGVMHGTPYIVPAERACTLCLSCGEACPTGAIEKLSKREDARMGVAVVDERLCVSHNGTGVCGACHTACPLRERAITQNLRNAPVVHRDACVGCGLCEEVCIVRDRRAIQVKSERQWAIAEKAAA